MFPAILATLMTSLGDTFWKKSLNFSVGGKVHDLLTYPVGIIIAILLLCMGIDFSTFDILIIGIVMITIFIDLGQIKMQQNLYRQEKYSVIAPYTNLSKILIIIGSFFLYKDVSIIALLITIVAIAVIILFSIDFQTLTLPKNIKTVVFIELLGATTGLIVGWLIINYSESLYFIVYTTLASFVMFMTVLFLGEFKTLKGQPKKFWYYRYLGGLGWIGWFLSLAVIKDLGLSVSILLSFLGIGAALVFAYIFSKDVPAKKDILMTVIVTALVGLGFYFK